MDRRGLLAALAASGAAAVAGCAGDDGSYEFDATPARVPERAYADTGYVGAEPEPFTIEQDFDIASVNARVSATTWTARYANEAVGSVLFVASTPDASVGGRSVNPLAQADDDELLRQLLEQVDQGGADVQTDDIEARGEEMLTVLGEAVSGSVFETTVSAEAETDGTRADEPEAVPVLVYVGTVSHDEDVIALVGVHPTESDESGTLFSMMERTEH